MVSANTAGAPGAPDQPGAGARQAQHRADAISAHMLRGIPPAHRTERLLSLLIRIAVRLESKPTRGFS